MHGGRQRQVPEVLVPLVDDLDVRDPGQLFCDLRRRPERHDRRVMEAVRKVCVKVPVDVGERRRLSEPHGPFMACHLVLFEMLRDVGGCLVSHGGGGERDQTALACGWLVGRLLQMER